MRTEKLHFPLFVPIMRAGASKHAHEFKASTIAEAFQRAQIFVLSKEGHKLFENVEVREDSVVEKPVSFPFGACYFERQDEQLFGFEFAQVRLEDGTVFDDPDTPLKSMSVQAMLVEELAPNKFLVAYLADFVSKDGSVKPATYSGVVEIPVKSGRLDKKALGMNLQLLEREILTSKFGAEKYHRSVNWADESGQKKPHPINYLIRTRSKENQRVEPVFARQIDWSHQWWVKGHWRKHDGIGKDRHGNYTIVGFTWVVPHLKGPDDKEIVEKIRLVESPA